MKYKITLTVHEDDSISMREGTLTNLSSVPADERKAVILDYVGDLIDRLAEDE